MIPREMYMSRIRPFIGSELIKVMTGIRRCGKSVMLELIKQELTSSGICPSQFISINFENMGYAHLQTAKALHDEILKRAAEIGGKVYLFFDEIQEVKDWEKCVNSLRVALDCDIYITGSNAKLLSGELATYLGGRYVEFVIYPFSFAEFMELYRSILPDEPVQKCFQKYLLSGGMPYLANIRYAEEPSRQYLHDLFRSIQLKDIVQRNKIRDVDLLERIIAYVMAHVGTTFSATSLAKYWKSEQRAVAPETILNYLKYCCDAYLFYQVKREDLQGKQILASNEKYYLADHGIREAVFGGNTRDINLILENIVYLELLRRGYDVTVGRTGDKEIDFVCNRRGEKLYVQVAYLLASEETVAREFGVYDAVRDHFPKYVVSLDEFDMSRNGINHGIVGVFLLMREWTYQPAPPGAIERPAALGQSRAPARRTGAVGRDAEGSRFGSDRGGPFLKGGAQLFQRFFLNAGDVGPADVALQGHLPLGQGLSAVQPVAQGQDFLLPGVQNLLHVLPQQPHVLPVAQPVEQIVLLPHHIHERQGVAVLARLDVVRQGDVRRAFALAAEVHEDFIFHAAGRVGGQTDALIGVKGGYGLNQADGADGDQILLIGRLGVVLFHNVGHQA